MPGSPETLLILIKLSWAEFGRFWMTKNFRDSKFFGAVDLLALDLESKFAWVFRGASHQVKVISALMANKLPAYRTTASIPLLFTNRERDQLPTGPTLPRRITSFLHFTQNTHSYTEAVHKDNSVQHTWGEDWQDFTTTRPLMKMMSRFLEEPCNLTLPPIAHCCWCASNQWAPTPAAINSIESFPVSVKLLAGDVKKHRRKGFSQLC